jgi:hypothetical protein
VLTRLLIRAASRSQSDVRVSGSVRHLLGSVHDDAEQWVFVDRCCCQI